MPQSPDTVSDQSIVQDRPSSRRRTRLERQCTITVNESFARDEVLLNLDLLGTHVKPGSLMAIDVLTPEADNKPTQNTLGKQASQDRAKEASPSNSFRAADSQKRYIFKVKEMPKELKIRYPTAEVYVAKHIADAFGMKRGTQVLLTPVRLHLLAY
jgi:hypothetical protein